LIAPKKAGQACLFAYFAEFVLRAGCGTETPGSFPWGFLSRHQPWTISVRAVLEQFGKRREEAIRQYRKFITGGLGDGHRVAWEEAGKRLMEVARFCRP